MTITNYTIEDSDRNDQGVTFEVYESAREYAQKHKMRVINNEYEFSDSWMVDDFTDDRCKQCQVPEHDTCSLTPGCSCCDDTIEGMRENR